MKKIVLAAIIAAVSATPAFAANSDTKQGSASATVVAPIVLTHTPGAVLNFGKFAAAAGTVTVSAAGAAGTTGSVVLLSGSANSADAFTVAGDQNRGYDITTTGGTLGSMSFTTTPSAASATLDATGNGSFTVGGTLTVSGTETAGVYNGNYDATVTYN